MTQPLNLPKKVPLLPGFQFSDPFLQLNLLSPNQKQNYHKTQQFAFVNKTNQEKENYVKEPLDHNLLASMKTNHPPNLTYGTKKEPVNDYIPNIPPPWLKYDRQVLRFIGYFQEHVVENKHENYRIRKCEIYYYLTDGTIYITEPKIENSGIPQGVFVKRQKVPKDIKNPNEFYSWEDFDLAKTMNFYERNFRIVDCDEFTAKFYADNKVKLGQPEAIPVDNFEFQKSLKDLKIQPPDTKEYKEYFEVKLGGGHPNNGLEKYITNDRKVLSFEVLWDDKSLEGGLNRYTMNFFLADDTVEVKEENKANSGKDPFPLLLRRSKLPKIPLMTHYPGMSLKKEEYYGPKDLIIGNVVKVYSRECLIYDCDEFTRHWYKNTLGIDQIPLSLKGEKPKKYYQPLPPYNGFGSEEDSLGSVFALMPKPPRKDLVKMFTQDQNILRYEARLISQNKEDNTRTFIISFFCGDDTIQVYEYAERNSGIWTGKFLERSKHKHPITNKYYTEKDFVLGDTIVLRNYKFQLNRADEFTVKYMISKPESFAGANIDAVIDRLRQAAKDYKSHEDYAIALFKHLDKNGNGFIEYEELHQGLKSLGVHLTPQQQYTLMRRFDENGDFKLSVEELLNGLYDVKK